MGEKKKQRPIGGQKPKKAPGESKVVIAITVDPPTLAWVKEWAARRDRSTSWAFNHFANERRNIELAERHLGQKIVSKKG